MRRREELERIAYTGIVFGIVIMTVGAMFLGALFWLVGDAILK